MLPEGPSPTADVIIELAGGGIVLVERRFPPPGWAIPGGFIEVGESAEAAAVREAREETGLVVSLTALLGVYSDPRRDPRRHTLGVVYIGRAEGTPQASDDAADAGVFTETTLPSPLAFDHAQILADYFHFRRTGQGKI
jgi:8-oxo-dGTP diphosphatase